MAVETDTARRGPLTGVRVVELAGLGPAQLGAMLLADMGADVVRVDRPADVPTDPEGVSGELLARGRRSIALDLKQPDGLAVARELAAGADVLLDPYRPGVAERLGLGPDDLLALNPRLVFARMTGWGQDGPLAQAAGHDINYVALAGALAPIGPADAPPPPPLNLVGDFGGGGMLLAFGVAAALVERERSGEGQVIDVAMIDGVAALMASIFQVDHQGLWSRERGANWLQGAAPWYRAYATADDRYVTVGPLEAKFYGQLLDRLGLDAADWPQWDTDRWPALAELLAARFAERTLAEWTAELEGTDVCFAPALEYDEVTEHPHLAARAVYVERDGAVQPAPAPRFARTPGAIASPPPWPGQHTAELLAELGVGGDRRAALYASGAARDTTTEEPR
ncbi:MAG: CoA transferase [Solirubrobacterales bacterium]|nr:CoA transferase [Solirubrobacterales bacterium]